MKGNFFLFFHLRGAANLWAKRKEYVKLWWQQEEMRGFVWLEENVHNDLNESLPVVKISKDTGMYSYSHPTGHPAGIRIARIIKETFQMGLPDVRWFILGDDDTVFAAENLLKVLGKYDHNELYYIGNPSECHSSNTYFSHNMAFGGGGIAISYPLAEALFNILDNCLERYPFLFGSDDRLHACIMELGVPLTEETGFHQFDVHGDVFGLLAAHPVTPFLSIHHLDEVDPFFPGYKYLESLQHLTHAMQTEPSSFLQRCICYDQHRRLTFSISSGYVVQVYPYIVLPRELDKPEITFKAWNKKDGGYEFNFDTRPRIVSVCSKPFRFYMERIILDGMRLSTTYKRENTINDGNMRLFCLSHARVPNYMQRIQVLSKPMNDQWFKVPRRQCCKVMDLRGGELRISVDSCQVSRNKYL